MGNEVALHINKIICADNCERLILMPKECIDLVVTSPPYEDLRTYGGHSWDFYGVAWNLKRVLKEGGVIVWIVADQTKNGDESGCSWAQAKHFQTLGLKLWDTMIWNKPNASPGDGKWRYHSSFEYMFVFCKFKPKSIHLIRDVVSDRGGTLVKNSFDRRRDESRGPKSRKPWEHKEIACRQNVWNITSGCNSGDPISKGHPAVFPEKIARDHILTWSTPGDLVLDPFNGSGTTTKCARELGRKYIGIDCNAEYCTLAEKRLAQQLLPFESGT